MFPRLRKIDEVKKINESSCMRANSIFYGFGVDLLSEADKNALYFKNHVCYNEGNNDAVGELR